MDNNPLLISRFLSSVQTDRIKQHLHEFDNLINTNLYRPGEYFQLIKTTQKITVIGNFKFNRQNCYSHYVVTFIIVHVYCYFQKGVIKSLVDNYLKYIVIQFSIFIHSYMVNCFKQNTGVRGHCKFNFG